MRQVIQGISVALALFTLAVQQAVQRTGQAQQFTRVLAAQPVPRASLDLVQLPAQPPQRTQAPGQAGPQQYQQRQQRCAKAQVELFTQAIEGVLVLAHRLQRNDAVGRTLAAEQFYFDVIDEELFAIALVDAGELVATPVVARPVVDVLVCGGPRLPHQVAFTVEDIAKQAGVRQVVALVRQQCRHLQLAVFDACCGDQRGHVRGQALLDGFLQGKAEGLLQGRQQRQHEQQRQHCGRQHQAHPQGTDHRQRSVNR
ncbi:hypothetical protein D3C76_426000 [compost metagenome]